MNTTIRPSRWMYLVSVGIFLLGIIIAIFLFIRLVTKALDASIFDVGLSTTVTAEAGDTMLLGITDYDNKDVTVTPGTTSTEVTIGSSSFTIAHDDSITLNEINDNTTLTIMEYNMIISMEFEESGTYEIITDSDGSFPTEIEMMLLPMGVQLMLIYTLGAFGAVGIGFVIALVVGIIIKVKRNKSKRTLTEQRNEERSQRKSPVEKTESYYE